MGGGQSGLEPLERGEAIRVAWFILLLLISFSLHTRYRLFTLVQLHTTLYYYRHTSSSSQAQDHKAVVDYFRISEDLTALYQQWGEKDTNFQQKASHCKGVRLLRQDPFEALIAFICSSNNNVPRISLMLNKLCQQFGRHVGHYMEKDYFTFPPVESLASEGCEEVLRKLGFGYRAKYVYQTARVIMEQHGGVKWLASLRDTSYKEAWETLQHLPGVGGKVADCVCLMALDHMGAVPVDTHVWRVAVRDYGMGETKGSGTLTARRYREVGKLEHPRNVQSHVTIPIYNCLGYVPRGIW